MCAVTRPLERLWRRWLARRSAASPRVYGTQVRRFELPRHGTVHYAQWLHPKETPKTIGQSLVDAAREFVAPGDLAIDIGAHTGDTTLPLALAAGPSGLVLALEPNPYVFEVLAQNSLLNVEKTHIRPLNVAATADDGVFVFHYSDDAYCNGGYLSQLTGRRHRHRHELSVRGICLADYLQRELPQWLPRLSYIKIDTEGYDLHVLRSLQAVLHQYQPVVVTEVYKRLVVAERIALFELLGGAGYDCFRLDEGARRTRLSRSAIARAGHYDLLALPQRRGAGRTSLAARQSAAVAAEQPASTA